MVKVDPDWWRKIFDEIYLLTDARSVCDHALTCREVDFLEQVLDLDKSWPILDLCGGQGRHSLELSRRGFKDVTVLDYSEFLIDLGRAAAKEEGLKTLFIRKDARNTDLPDLRFKVVIVMASSFGYFGEEIENEKILHEVFRLLMPGGVLLLDLPNRDLILDSFRPLSWHEASDDIVVCRQRRLDSDVIFTREMVLSKEKGLIRDECYSTRIYKDEKISRMLSSAGFSSIDIQKNFLSREDQGDYGCMDNRMIIIAFKA